MIMTPPQCPAARTRGFALTLALLLLALVTGLGVVLTLHTGQFVQADRLRTLDVELRQMIDSGIAYAHLHRGVWPAGSEPVILDGTASNAVETKYTWGLDLSGLAGDGTARGIHV